MMKCRILILIVLFLFIPLATLSALDSIGVTGGVIYVRNSSDDGAPSPILPYIGINAVFRLDEKLSLEPSLSLTANYYLWSETGETAIPAEIEYADSVLLLNLILDCPVVMKYRVKENVSLGMLASPAFIFRVPLKAWGEGEDRKKDITSYFYGGRFIFLETGGLVEWNYSENKSFQSRLDILFPVYHIWDGGAFSDHLSVRLGFVFSFLRKNRTEARQ